MINIRHFTHYAKLYPQNGDRIVAVDSVTSLRPMYSVCMSMLQTSGRAALEHAAARAVSNLAIFIVCECRTKSSSTTAGVRPVRALPVRAPASATASTTGDPTRGWSGRGPTVRPAGRACMDSCQVLVQLLTLYTCIG